MPAGKHRVRLMSESSLTDEDIKKTAKLARIEVSDTTSLYKDCREILSFVKQLEEYDVSDVEPLSHVHGISNITRKDTPTEQLSNEEALKNAPQFSKSFFKTPLVVE